MIPSGRRQTGQILAEAVRLANIGDYIAMRLCHARKPVMSSSIAASMGGHVGSGRAKKDFTGLSLKRVPYTSHITDQEQHEQQKVMGDHACPGKDESQA